MGCDIHAYIDYRETRKPSDEEVARLAGRRGENPVAVTLAPDSLGTEWWDVKVGTEHPIGRPNRDLSVAVAAMRALEAFGLEVRLVFWFDN